MNKVKLRVNTLCSGIGAQEKGIKETGLFDLEVVATSEINKEAVVSYAAIHCGLTNETIILYQDYPPLDDMKRHLESINLGYVPEKDKKYNWFQNGAKFNESVKKYWLACKLSNNLGDVSKIECLPEADLWFTSYPCQSISIAGKLKGLDPDSGTRSSLVWQTIRLLKTAQETNTLPKYIILENVKNLVGKKFIKNFETYNSLIEEFGYNAYWKVLNAKDTGIPQNRERVFVVYIRKDIDTGNFTFPIPFDNGLRLKDMLDDNVDESYYINTEKAQELIQKLIDDGTLVDLADLEKTSGPVEINKETNREKKIGNIFGTTGGNFAGNVYDQRYIAPALNTMGGGNRQPMIIEYVGKEENNKERVGRS